MRQKIISTDYETPQKKPNSRRNMICSKCNREMATDKQIKKQKNAYGIDYKCISCGNVEFHEKV